MPDTNSTATHAATPPPSARSVQIRHTVEDAAALFAHSVAGMTGPSPSERGECVIAAQEALRARIARVVAGDTSDLERDLAAQAALLNVLVAYFVERALVAESAPAREALWRTVLRAQAAQCRTTATLAGMMLAKRDRQSER